MKRIYFKKLLLMYTAVLFILTMAFFSIFFVLLERSEREKLAQQHEVLLQDYVTQQEDAFFRLKSNAEKISSFDTLAAFALSTGTDYYAKMTQFKTDLQKYSDSARPTFMVHKYGDSTVISNTQTTKMEYQLKDFGLTMEQYNSVLLTFVPSDLYNHVFLLTDEGVLYVTTRTVAGTRMIITTFSPTWDTQKDYGNGISASYFVAGDGIVDFRTESVSAALPEDAVPAEIPSREITDFTIQGVNYLFYPSSYAGDVVYYLRAEPGMPLAFTALLSYLPYALLAFLISFGVVLYFSKMLYQPIDELVNTFMEMHDQEDEWQGKNEFDYLVTQVARIRTENVDLTNAMQNNFNSSKQQFLADVVQGHLHPDTQENDLQRFSLEWLAGGNFLMRMELHMLPAENAAEVSARVADIALQQLEQQFHTAYVYLNQGENCFVINTQEFGVLEAALRRLSAVIDAAFGLPSTFYVSKLSNGVEELHYCLLTLEKVYEARSLTNMKTVYGFSDVRGTQRSGVLYPVATEQKLISCVENGNWSGIEQTLGYIFKEYGAAVDTPQTKQIFISALSNTLSRCAQRLSANSEAPAPVGLQGIYRALQVCNDRESVRQTATDLLHTMLDTAGQTQTSQTHAMRSRIETYVKENVTKDISLITMADDFHLTPNYMSSIFKEAMGETFKDYTSRVRFETAVEVLRQNPGITLADLAARVGLNNTTTLVRLFKKYAGCSPSVYLQKYPQ